MKFEIIEMIEKPIDHIFRIIALIFLFNGCLEAQNSMVNPGEKGEASSQPIKYFDAHNRQISKSEFDKKLSTRDYFRIPGDSINHQKLIFREETGQIQNVERLYELVKQTINKKIDVSKPLVVIYYPGKDRCNSGGTATKTTTTIWYRDLEWGLKRIAKVKPIYIYKSDEGLERYRGIKTWRKDPENTFEQLFFEHKYPCGSFVVISKTGEYISYFGEYPMEFVWEATKILTE